VARAPARAAVGVGSGGRSGWWQEKEKSET
jgi:hypothetical protein